MEKSSNKKLNLPLKPGKADCLKRAHLMVIVLSWKESYSDPMLFEKSNDAELLHAQLIPFVGTIRPYIFSLLPLMEGRELKSIQHL